MKIKTIALGVLVCFAAIACSKEAKLSAGKTGNVSFTVANDGNVEVSTRANVSDFTTLPSASDFTIDVVNSSSESVYSGLLSAWDATTALTSGNYTVTASYGSLEDEGFDKPYFTGSQSFSVNGGETTAVSIPVSLGNTIVKISCTDNFKNYFTAYSFKLTRDNSDIVTFAQDETNAAFVDGYKFTLEGSFTTETGSSKSFSQEYTNLDEMTCYTFTFDVSNTGGAKLTISYDDTVTEVDLGDTELNE